MFATYSDGGINWTWYLDCEHHDDHSVTILRHYRLHNTDNSQGANKHPKISGGYRVIESDPVFVGPWKDPYDAIRSKRDVVGVQLTRIVNGKTVTLNFPVRNVKNVFAYKS